MKFLEHLWFNLSSAALAQDGRLPASVGGGFLYPDCLRTADAAQAAGSACILESINHYISLLAAVVAIGAFFFLLYGSFQYVTAFGDESKAASAKKIITSSLIGVFLASLSWLIIRYIAQLLNVPDDLIN